MPARGRPRWVARKAALLRRVFWGHINNLKELATQQDIGELEVKLDAKIRESELKLETKIADTRADLIRWVVSAGILQTAIIAALLLSLIKG